MYHIYGTYCTCICPIYTYSSNIYIYLSFYLYIYFYIIWLSIFNAQGSRLRPFFESVRVKIWRGRTFASAWSALLQSLCFIQQLQHIVAGERFHWSREERRFQRERFSRAWFTPVSHRKQSRGSTEAARMQSGSSARPLCFHSPEREGARSGRSMTEDLVF